MRADSGHGAGLSQVNPASRTRRMIGASALSASCEVVLMLRYVLTLSAGLLGFTQVALAQEMGDPERGLSYAKKNCASCHAVSAHIDTEIINDAPAFVDVANTPGMTATAIAVWLQTPHPNMPNFIIPEHDIDDLAAYITSLKRPK